MLTLVIVSPLLGALALALIPGWQESSARRFASQRGGPAGAGGPDRLARLP